ncbi:hypothetical protein EMCRGX_G033326 [Ephydatia muelleri]
MVNFGKLVFDLHNVKEISYRAVAREGGQDHYYTTDHISLGPYDKGSLFLGVSRDDADQSLINASKFLLNHFFKMYGLETCCSMLAIAVAVRIDIYGIFYAMVLGLLMLVPRPPSKAIYGTMPDPEGHAHQKVIRGS